MPHYLRLMLSSNDTCRKHITETLAKTRKQHFWQHAGLPILWKRPIYNAVFMPLLVYGRVRGPHIGRPSQGWRHSTRRFCGRCAASQLLSEGSEHQPAHRLQPTSAIASRTTPPPSHTTFTRHNRSCLDSFSEHQLSV